jgi:hypothetical protein
MASSIVGSIPVGIVYALSLDYFCLGDDDGGGEMRSPRSKV